MSMISKYTLSHIVKHVNGDDIDFNTKNVTLEHVLPRNVTDEWNEFSEMEHEENLYRLGNYVLLEDSINKEAGNQVFEAKSKLYETSQFGMTRKLAEENTTWNPERINRRQLWMANLAKTIWRVDQIGR